MQTGHKFLIHPTREQQSMLLQWIGCQRFIYNAKVGEDRYFRKFKRKSPALCSEDIPIDQKYAHFITELSPFLRDVPSQILRNGAFRWRTAHQRFTSGAVKGRPKIRKKTGRQSVLLTQDLFSFIVLNNKIFLFIGTKKRPLGLVPIHDHDDCPLDAVMVYVGVEGGRWSVSFSTDDATDELLEIDIAQNLQALGEDKLLALTEGIDLGVVQKVATSSGVTFDLSETEKKRTARADRYARRWQRIAARRQKGSNNQKKAQRKVARYKRYQANVRQDFSHKTSRTLVNAPGRRLFVFEDMKIKNMSRSAKGTVENPGKNVKQKSGLNRSILESCWGKIKTFTRYKARRDNKLLICVPPHFSSQECSQCGYIHQDNRPSQAVFVCQCCGHSENADVNAAKTIKARGVRMLLAGEIDFPKPRKCGIRKLGPGRSEVKPEEKTVSRRELPLPAPPSLIRETPTTRALAV